MTPQDLVPVYSAADPINAQIVKNLLEEEGIRAFIENETQATFTGTTAVKVLVEASRAEDARKLIEPHEEQAVADALANNDQEIESASESTAPTA